MKTSFLLLGDIVSITKGRKHQSVVNGINRYINIEDLHNPENTVYTDETGIFVNKDDLIIAWDGANAGKVGVGFDGVIGSTLARLQIKVDKINSRYLYWFLNSSNDLIKSQRTGATIPHVSGIALKELQTPLPPLAIQKRIAEILDAADALRRKDQELLKKYDELAQAIFIDMFGDPVKNDKGWDVRKLASMGKLDRGISKHRPRNAPELLGGIYPLIQTGDVSNSGGRIKRYKSTYSELGLKQSRLWPAGTLCITIAANIAKTGILNFPACFPDSIVGFTPNVKIATSIYIQFWFFFLQSKLEELAPESAQKNINLEILRKIEVMCPPMEMQLDFDKKINNIEIQKSKSIDQISSMLFKSLLQKAFKDELVS